MTPIETHRRTVYHLLHYAHTLLLILLVPSSRHLYSSSDLHYFGVYLPNILCLHSSMTKR